jgi:hypothetical protein
MKLTTPILGVVGGAVLLLAGIIGAHYFDQGWGGSTFHLGMSYSEVVEVCGIVVLIGSLIIALIGVVFSRIRRKSIDRPEKNETT